MPEERAVRKRRVPSGRRFAAGALASVVAVFGVLALRVHDGSDPALGRSASSASAGSSSQTTGSSASSDDTTTSSGDDGTSSSAVTATPPATTSAS